MAITQKVLCDVTGKELVGQDMVNMTVVNIQHKIVDKVDVRGTDGSITKKDFVKQVDRYEFHISLEHSNDFMKHIQAFFKKGE